MPKTRRKRSSGRSSGGDFPETWAPEKGDKLVGKVVRKDTVETRIDPESPLIVVKDKDGDKTTVWCGGAALSILWDEVEKGDKVSIKYVRKDKGRMGRRYFEAKVNGEEVDLDPDEDDDDDDDDEDDEDDEEDDD